MHPTMVNAGEHESPARRVFARTIYPALMVCAIAAAIGLLRLGVHGGVVLAVVSIAAFLIIIAGEHIFPYRESWSRSREDVRVDAGHTFVITGAGVLVQPALLAGGALLAAALSDWIDIGIWPRQWPLVLQLVVALILVEFLQYWTHRMQHQWEWAWRFHAVHHSAPRLYWLNAGRFHVGDTMMHKLTGHLPLIALGGGIEVFVLVELFTLLSGVMQHANLETRLGPLNWIFSASELHRWHHSPLTAEANHNYGRNLIIWDVIFGTRFRPAGRVPPERVGLEAMDAYPMGFWAQVASPLHWRRIVRESRQIAMH